MVRLGVVKPKIDNDVEFEINSNFKGTDDEDAHEHVRRVLEITDLFHFTGVTHDVVMLRVFPITLKGPALRWINRLSVGLVTTWDLLEKAFIRQYCPPLKIATKLEEICNFKQEVDEPLYRAWERYSDLLYRYPQHDLNNQEKVHSFYTGLYIPTRIMLDSKSEFQNLRRDALNRGVYSPKRGQDSEKVKARTTMSKENVKEPVPRDLLVVQTYVPPTKFLVKNVDRFRQILTPTIHTLPNLEPMVQSYVTRGPVHDKEKVVREKEQDYDIPLQDHIMQPLTPHTVNIAPPDDNYVAPATNPILNKHLNEFRKEFANNTWVSKKIDSNPVNDLKELLKTYDFQTSIQELLHQLSQSSYKIGKVLTARN
nr:hypothetical protein [Tanacetum cinerariifolium]